MNFVKNLVKIAVVGVAAGFTGTVVGHGIKDACTSIKKKINKVENPVEQF